MKIKLCLLLLFSLLMSNIQAQIPTNNLLASYEFNGDLSDGIGSSDLTGGSVPFIADRLGNANAAINVNTTQLLGYNYTGTINQMTIGFWAAFNPTSPSTERVFQFYDSSGDGFRFEYDRVNGLMTMTVNTVTGAQFSNNSVLTTTASNQWHHFTITINKTPSSLNTKVYIDGSQRNDFSINVTTGGNNIFSGGAQLNISPIGGNSPQAYRGLLDDIYLYDRELSSSEVNALYIGNSVNGVKYVDINATGNNNGTSWADAYTDLNSLLSNLSEGDEIWVAKGVYNPGSSSSNDYFINQDNVKIYGGFAGTETDLSDRDLSLIHTTNQTIFSGDISGNDDSNVTYNNSTRSENSLKVFTLTGNNVLFDGFTIADGYADGTAGNNRFGAGVYLVENSVTVFTAENCIFKDNVSYWGAGIYFNPQFNSSLRLNACVFENNLSGHGASFYALPADGTTMNIQITNSLFNGNRSEDDTSMGRTGLGAPAGWVRAFFNNSRTNLTLVNNTFVNNSIQVTGVGTDLPVFGIARKDTNTAVSTFNIANNIFWGNTSNGGTTSLAIGRVLEELPVDGTDIFHTINEEGFTNLSNPGTNNSTINPNLTSDFKLQSSSTAAINTGLNGQLPAGIILDLAGNTRTIGSNIDIGAYEYDASLSTTDLQNDATVRLYPNPADNIVYIDAKNVIEKIEVYSILGKKVLSKKSTNEIQIRNLKPGIYLIKMRDSNGSILTKKFIKK